MPTEPQPAVRAAVPADAERVAAIFAHYVTTSVATFEEVAPTAADWRQRLGELAGQNLPFLVAEAGGSVCGFAYAGPWRPKSGHRHTVEDSVYLSPDRTGSDASAALHRRFGFTRAGLLSGVGRKHGRWIDTLLMQKELGTWGPAR
jgi:L-amino acid N-acyltransferase YncA